MKLYILSDNNSKPQIVRIPKINLKEKIIFIPFSERILRVFPSAYILINEDLYFCIGKRILRYNIVKNTISDEFYLRDVASKTLNFCATNDSLFFGEYITRKNDEGTVHIYQKSKNDEWKIFYSFKNNSIRHIHNILFYKDSLVVMTGDESYESTIQMISIDKKVSSIIYEGNQIFRGAAAVIVGDSLIYATDNPYSTNFLVSINLINKNIEILAKLPSSSVYFCNNDEYFFFSTLVEKNLKKKNGKNKQILIDGKNGGILSKCAKVYALNLKNGNIKSILSKKRKLLPYLFGFGTFRFGVNFDDGVFFTSDLLVGKNKNYFYKNKEIQFLTNISNSNCAE